MPTHVSDRTVLAVTELLRLSNTPMTTKELARALDKSYEAIRQAVARAELIPADSSYPTRWIIDGTHNAVRTVPSKHDGMEYVVAGPDNSGLVLQWNKSREQITSKLAELEITPASKPADLALRIGTASGILAKLAFELDEVAGKPDWYEILTEGE